jgi:protein-tyrosine phosphatase
MSLPNDVRVAPDPPWDLGLARHAACGKIPGVTPAGALRKAFVLAEREHLLIRAAGGYAPRMTAFPRSSRRGAIGLAFVVLGGCSDALPLADRVELGVAIAGAGGTASAGVAGMSTAGSGGTSAGAGGSGSGGTAGSGATGNATCAPSSVVLAEDGIVNARDLGGIPLEDGRTVKCGMLFRGPPLTLTPNGCGSYEQLGVRVVVDLRQPGEGHGRLDAACTTDDETVIAAPLPIPYMVSPQNYIADLNTLDSMALIFHALGTEAGYPMYFHCTWGRDRTAVVAAVILTALGASREAIMADYNISGATVGSYPQSLEATLDELERRGGVEAYYAELGVSADELAFLREHATEQ